MLKLTVVFGTSSIDIVGLDFERLLCWYGAFVTCTNVAFERRPSLPNRRPTIGLPVMMHMFVVAHDHISMPILPMISFLLFSSFSSRDSLNHDSPTFLQNRPVRFNFGSLQVFWDSIPTTIWVIHSNTSFDMYRREFRAHIEVFTKKLKELKENPAKKDQQMIDYFKFMAHVSGVYRE